MEEEEKNNEQGFIKEQTGKLKEKGKEEAKKRLIKNVIIPYVTAHASIFIGIGLIIAFWGLILWFAISVKIIGDNKISKALDAKNSAINLGLQAGSSTSIDDQWGINISYKENGVYTFQNNFTEEQLDGVRATISKTGRDVSDFSDFEIGIIGSLMNNGLNTQDYTLEQLKCLPLFIRTEACTSYLDLRPNSKKFDASGNYQPEKLEDLKENEIPGVILVQRTNTKSDTPVTLEYIDLNSFNEMASQNDMNVLNYFTIDEYGNLLIAKWKYIKVEVEGEYPSGAPKTSESEEYIILPKPETIAYNEYVRKYTMPYDFLLQLLVTTDEAEFCRELTNIVNGSKIIINIQEEETKTVEQDIQTYTVYHQTETTTTSVEDENESQSDSSSETTESEQATVTSGGSVTSEEGTVTVTTTEITHEYTPGITEADTWIIHYLEIYKKSEMKQTTEGPFESSKTGKYGEPSTITSPSEDGKTETKTSTRTKVDEEHSITTQIEEYPSDPDPTKKTHIYAKDGDGNFEKFLLILDKYAYSSAMLDSIDGWLYDRMESSGNTEALVDYIKYILYVYDGRDRGVTDLDTEIFEPSDFKTAISSNGMIVKTDEMLAIKTLTKKELEEVITKSFKGQARENLLSVIDDLMYIQDTYHVNAVFAIAVTRAESGCGTNWDLIDPSTYNWCSIQGNYNGNYYTDRENTNWRKYTSFGEAIRDFGDWIANGGPYYKDGNYSTAQIGKPYKGDDHWAEDVSGYIKDMYENIGASMYDNGGNDLQQKVAEVAQNSSRYGIIPKVRMCQAWVKDVYERAGVNEMSMCCAVHCRVTMGSIYRF